jgi:hypothetical protein
MPPKKKATSPKTKPPCENASDSTKNAERPASGVTFMRLLPCPGAHAIHIFASLKLEPPKLEKIFMAVAIGPNLADLHAMATVGVMRDANLRGVEISQAFALDDPSYMAVCEGIRAVLSPLGFVRFEGSVNMLSRTEPIRVLESRHFYEPIDPNLPHM